MMKTIENRVRMIVAASKGSKSLNQKIKTSSITN